jgi:hypothetical protein
VSRGAKLRVIGHELPGRVTLVGGLSSAAQWTQALALEPHEVKVVADFS